jgi:hypothetical protein
MVNFWYSNILPKETGNFEKTVSQVSLLYRPDTYGRKLSQVNTNIKILTRQLKTVNMGFTNSRKKKYILLKETSEPEIDMSKSEENNGFSKSVMGTIIHVEANVAPEVLEKRLIDAEFKHPLPAGY